jgi:hypothetical protein
LLQVWNGEKTTSLRGNQLLILTEDSSQIAHSMVSLVEQLSISSSHAIFTEFSKPIERALAQLAIVLHQIAAQTLKPKRNVYLEAIEETVEVLVCQRQALRTHLNAGTMNTQAIAFKRGQ